MILFKNAEVFDGEKFYKGCVLIDKGSIIYAGELMPQTPCARAIDCGGRVLCPGFIDTHSHNDYFAPKEGNARFFEPLIAQGITSVVAGNCGYSAAGTDKNTAHEKAPWGLFPYDPDFRSYSDFSDFYALTDKNSPVNIKSLVGHGTLRATVRGLAPGELTGDEAKKMEALLRDALEKGAIGLSFGLMYAPGMFAGKAELVRFAKIAAEYGKLITFHIRANSSVSTSYDSLFGRAHNLRAFEEAIEVARESGASAHVSHLIFVGKSSWKTLDENLELIDRANASGLDMSFDMYSSDFGASTINVILPSWYQAMTPEERKKSKLRLFGMINGAKLLLGISFNDIEIAWAPGYPQYTGRRIDELAREKGLSPLKAYLKIIDETNAGASIYMYKYANEHIIDVLSRHPRVSYMTDAWLSDNGKQNAALYGSFPKFLRLSREGRAAPLGEFLHRATKQAAERFGLSGRGEIKAGCAADIVVFDKLTARENGTQPPTGIDLVMINGDIRVDTLAGESLK